MSTPHGDIGLGGPGLWVIGIVLILVAASALAMLIDLARRRRLVGGPFLAALWIVSQVAYLGSLGWGYMAKQATDISGRALLIALPVAFVAQIAYVLKVVFPRRRGETGVEPAPSSGLEADESDLNA